MIQIDGRGFIKGTNIIHKADVVVLRTFSTNGTLVNPGDIIKDFTGDALVSCLSLKKVRMFNPEIDAEVNGKCVPKESLKVEEVVETKVEDKKLGPKKSKKKKSE